MLSTVVNGNRQPNHLRQYHGTAGPGFNRALTVAGYRVVDLLKKMMVYKRAFLIERATLSYLSFDYLRFATTHDHLSVRLFCGFMAPLVGTPQGLTG